MGQNTMRFLYPQKNQGLNNNYRGHIVRESCLPSAFRRFVHGCHGNAEMHMRTKFHFQVLHCLRV